MHSTFCISSTQFQVYEWATFRYLTYCWRGVQLKKGTVEEVCKYRAGSRSGLHNPNPTESGWATLLFWCVFSDFQPNLLLQISQLAYPSPKMTKMNISSPFQKKGKLLETKYCMLVESKVGGKEILHKKHWSRIQHLDHSSNRSRNHHIVRPEAKWSGSTTMPLSWPDLG